MKDLLSSLNDLRNRLNISSVERTIGLRDAMGENCTYYRKSRNLFLEKDYQDLKRLTLEVLEELRKVEGSELGK